MLPAHTTASGRIFERLGLLDPASRRALEVAARLFGTSLNKLLRNAHEPDIVIRLEQRERVIADSNANYAANFQLYCYHHLTWLHLHLTSRSVYHLSAFASEHLGLAPSLLPVPAKLPYNEEGIVACFKAARDVEPKSEVAARYFAKRYRSLMLGAWWTTRSNGLHSDSSPPREAESRILDWLGRQDEPRLFEHLASVAPALRHLFPAALTPSQIATSCVPEHLPTKTDRRLWRHVVDGAADTATTETMARLGVLERAQITRWLPAEAMLELASQLRLVRASPQDPVVWEGDADDDLYFVVAGVLVATRKAPGDSDTVVRRLGPGDVFGETPLLTGLARDESVRAESPAEMLVMKAVDFTLLAFRYPTVLWQLSTALASPLAGVSDED